MYFISDDIHGYFLVVFVLVREKSSSLCQHPAPYMYLCTLFLMISECIFLFSRQGDILIFVGTTRIVSSKQAAKLFKSAGEK